MIRKTLPVFDPPKAKNAAYRIEDMFFRFWFRFVFRNQEMIELGRYEALREIVARDFDTFSGFALERYFYWKFVEDTSYTKMGGWWNRKGEDEFDLVCEDELSGRLDFYEVKRDAARYSPDGLKANIASFFAKHPQKRELNTAVKGLSLADM